MKVVLVLINSNVVSEGAKLAIRIICCGNEFRFTCIVLINKYILLLESDEKVCIVHQSPQEAFGRGKLKKLVLAVALAAPQVMLNFFSYPVKTNVIFFSINMKTTRQNNCNKS